MQPPPSYTLLLRRQAVRKRAAVARAAQRARAHIGQLLVLVTPSGGHDDRRVQPVSVLDSLQADAPRGGMDEECAASAEPRA